MKIHQLSVFLENKPGHLSHVCQALAEAGINLLTLALADTAQFGILRLIVEDWKRAAEVLRAAGAVVSVNEVVAMEVEDRPGGLAAILKAADGTGVNIDYMYAFTFRNEGRAIMVFRFSDPDAAIAALTAKGIGVLGSVELYRRAKA